MTVDPEILTFGCRLNIHESEVMRGHARTAGLADTIIVNTCAVTAEAERQARQAIRRARRRRPDARIVVTGCAAQIDPGSFAAMPEVSVVLGNDAKLKPESWRGLDEPDGERVRVNDIASVTETAGHLLPGFEANSRGFVQVQNGCDHRCTFCVIPFGRGPSRSVPVGEIAAQVRALVEAGYKEIVLSGVDVTSYGGDLPGRPGLGQMIRRLLALTPDLPRLRLSSLDCVEIDDDLWRLIAEEERLMPHLHLSLQAGDDMILKRMKRRHSRADAVALTERARALRPDIVFGADLIAGFPTETDAMFENTLAAVEECGLTWLHVFPYSERPGTPAARMPAVPPPVRKERAARLRAAGEARATAFLRSQAGRTVEVLMERNGAGRTPHFALVSPADPPPAGTLAKVFVTGAEDGYLTSR
ncbi:tRNA (N(6)-L-threonylcarbamoyladenosine(37)-C(2))-methylthiotransferase MtaB [Inquilinus sp. CAU 1745]|uniref:tRNA (N(6)-L-threonylcarbamoyladenosine(37)-C(2))- methylthiotransferase MtaB n=1 Tax=Inquilinus sp. CAU 1745 TaxID=3140369 RepID=UPI00325B0007